MISLTDAQTYFDTKLDTDGWDYATSDRRTIALLEAVRILSRLNYAYGIDLTTEPQWYLDAQCEIALALLNGVKPFREANILEETFGQGKVRLSGTPEYYNTGVPCAEAWVIIRPYLRDNLTIDIRKA